MSKLRVFVASPGDVKEERDVVSLVVVPELRRVLPDLLKLNIDLEAVRWETHAWPDVGVDAQDVINQQIGQYDIFVGMMWKRFGTPTGRADSGTDEEFTRAYEYHQNYGRPHIMFYFREEPFFTTDLAVIDQYRKVVEFRGALYDKGVLFWTYEEPLAFERLLREHLLRTIPMMLEPTTQEARPSPSAPSPPPAPPPQPKRPRVFLSYSSKDRERVRPIYQALRVAGLDPWLDTEDLLPGQDWGHEIRKAVTSSDFIVVFFSENATRPGYVQKEIRIALDVADSRAAGEVFLIPVRLDAVEVPDRVRQYQWLDLFQPDGVDRLVSVIRGQH